MSGTNLPAVLLVEDSPHDIDFARRAFARCRVEHLLIVAEEGDRAWELLSGEDRLRPALVLLDLNIPGLSGVELLERLKQDRLLSTIPVVILTTSAQTTDVAACYRRGANSYHQKPTDFRAYQETIRKIVDYWLGSIVPPPGREGASAPRRGGIRRRPRCIP